jgi:hypothetical protein
MIDVSSILDEPWACDFLDIGCMPDYVAGADMRMHRRTATDEVKARPVRELGGHIHISLPPPFINEEALAVQFVRELDAIIYPLAMGVAQPNQQSWYRKRRLFRPTPYGIEYRSLGSEELLSDNAEQFLSLVFDISASVWEV